MARTIKGIPCLLLLLLTLFAISAFGQRTKPSIRRAGDINFSAPIQDLAISTDGASAAVALIGSLNKVEVDLVRLPSGEPIHTFTFDESDLDRKGHEPVRVRFTPDGTQLAVSFRSRIYFYDLKTFAELRQLGVAGDDVLHMPAPMREIPPRLHADRMPFTPEEIADEERWRREYAVEVKRIAKQGDGRLRITDFSFTREMRFVLASYCFGDCWMEQANNRKVYWFSGGDDPVRLWDLHSGEVVWQRYFDPNEVIEQVTPLPDASGFIATSNNTLFAPVTLRSIANGDMLYTLPAFQSPTAPPQAQFTADGRSMIIRYDEKHDYDDVYGW